MPGRGIAVLLWFSLGALAWAADWPQWRGPNRDGISSETGLLDTWPKGGPPLVWKIQGLGEGYSSPAIAGGRLFIQGQQGDEEYVLAFDAATGKQLWRATRVSRSMSRAGMGRVARPQRMATGSTH